MNAYLALIRINLRLSMREKSVLFFNYFFPLVFFFGFGQFMGAQAAGVGAQLISMVLVIGVLGSGLFGAGMRTVMEREANILRRYKVTPISPLPILVSSVVVGWLLYVPSATLIIVLSHFVYGVMWPSSPISLLIIVSVGAWAFRALGLIIASVANSVAESNILIQILYMPMLFISGATIPLNVLPDYVQVIAQFLPASYLTTGIGRVLLRGEGVMANIVPIVALTASTALSLFVAVKLFRWEKEERIGGGAKAWVAGVMLPFIGLGVWQAYSRDHIIETEVLNRELRRVNPHLIRGGRVFVGDGRVIENATVLVQNGKIAAIFENGGGPDPDDIGADLIEAAGKTVLPGLIDLHVHLASPGGAIEDPKDYNVNEAMDRALAAYLYSGVIAVRSAGDFTDYILDLRRRVNRGQQLGADLFVVGPLFTADGGHGTEFLENAPELMKFLAGEQFIRTPKTPDEARVQVQALKAKGVDGIKAVLESGAPGMLFQRLDLLVLRAIGEQAQADGLPLLVHTGDAQDVADAVATGARVIEHGSARNAIPDPVFAEMRRLGAAYDPTLSVIEALTDLAAGNMTLLDRSLVQQAAPEGMVAATRKQFASPEGRKAIERLSKYPAGLAIAGENLVRAVRAGVTVVPGTDSGNPLLLHGPAIHRELQLWVAAGLTPSQALRAATHSAAKALGVDSRIGLIQPGYEASLIVVDGNPLEDIAATERISTVILKGERIGRQDLFEGFE